MLPVSVSIPCNRDVPPSGLGPDLIPLQSRVGPTVCLPWHIPGTSLAAGARSIPVPPDTTHLQVVVNRRVSLYGAEVRGGALRRKVSLLTYGTSRLCGGTSRSEDLRTGVLKLRVKKKTSVGPLGLAEVLSVSLGYLLLSYLQTSGVTQTVCPLGGESGIPCAFISLRIRAAVSGCGIADCTPIRTRPSA